MVMVVMKHLNLEQGDNMVLDLSFSVVFPLLQIYHARFGYSEAFQHDTDQVQARAPVSQDSANAEEKTMRMHPRKNTRPSQWKVKFALGPLVLYAERKGQSGQHEHNEEDTSPSSSASSTLDKEVMLENLEERIYMKIVNAMKEHHQTTVLKKVVERYEEDNQILQKQNYELTEEPSAATASSQLYCSLLHEADLN
ncbi:OLC1v1034042C1 [Oldenlandia corymbosa var. corymbosa]|uniref:OLC1v1034042C1 n=1 Tax=Oldenlandia corymbosa var. corymbosa TaxID=529605 RepID=A0AAV1CSG1_OLDCO|nr:OLC1v1034042C1 [Oldenlandia corymbosa var. corymbosa]